jgi:hypothetical protein
LARVRGVPRPACFAQADIRGRSRKLYLNYRTTDEIRRQAVAVLEGCEVDDLDNGNDETKRYKSLSRGPAPVVVQAEGLEAAAAQAIGFIKALRAEAADGQTPTICVIASRTSSAQAASARRSRLKAPKSRWMGRAGNRGLPAHSARMLHVVSDARVRHG